MTRRSPTVKPEEVVIFHSPEWIKWWTEYKERYYRFRPNKKQEASEFIISMSGPAADRLAKKYHPGTNWKKPTPKQRY